MCAVQNYANQGIRCWSGNDDEAHAARHEFGGQGVISVTSNLLPGLYSRLMNSPNQELMDSLQALVAWLFCEPNPIGVNTAMVRHPNLADDLVMAYQYHTLFLPKRQGASADELQVIATRILPLF